MELLKKIGTFVKVFIPGFKEYKEISNKEKEIELEKFKISENRSAREKEQQEYFKNQKELASNKYFIENAWPLLMPPEYMNLSKNSNGYVSMRVIMAESNDPEFQLLLGDSIKNKLNSILTEIFSLNSTHSINFYFDGWKKSHNGGTPSLDALFQILKGQPTLVLMPIISDQGETLLLRTSFWGLGFKEENPINLDFLKIPLGRIKRDVSREYAKRWRDFKKRIQNINPQEFNPIDELNLQLLINEETLINQGIDIDEIEKRTTVHYKYNIDDKRLSQDIVDYIVASIEATISFISDIYYVVEYNCKTFTPYILGNLQHASYLPSVSQQILPLYEASANLIRTSNNASIFLKIDKYSLKVLAEKVSYLLEFSGFATSNNISTLNCALRLIWDERLSELFSDWQGNTQNDVDKEKVSIHIFKILTQFDNKISKGIIYRFVEKLSTDPNKESIVFAITSRHNLIREFNEFSKLASFLVYENLKLQEEGKNWVITFEISETIAELSKGITPSVFIENEKESFEKKINDVVQKYYNNIKSDNTKKLACDPLFVENIRKIADLLVEFNKSENNYLKIIE